MPSESPCQHLVRGSWPLNTELVIDDQLGLAEGIMRCRHCQRCYLLEMIDWRGPLRAYRISLLAADHAAALIRSLTRGSCDLSRAGAELQHAKTSSRRTPWLLVADTRGPVIDTLTATDAEHPLPSRGWRDLPCDGTWIDYARSKTQMANG